MDELKLQEIVNPILEEEGLFLVEIVIKGNVNNQKLIVLIDGDEGISIDQCGKVSRQLGNRIEEEDLIKDRYTLEVSSPGLDFPLKIARQYSKNVGRTLMVDLTEGKRVEGKLTRVDESGIRLEIKNEEREYPFHNIQQSKVKISFK